MDISPVRTKEDFYRRWRAMEFGNRGHSWDTLDEVFASGLPGPFAIRYRVPGSRWCRYNIPREHMSDAVQKFLLEGALPELMEFSPMQPDDKLLIQGEVLIDHRGLCLAYSHERKPMRVAMRNASHLFGISAVCLLRRFLDHASYDDLTLLAERYHRHVIEFGTYACKVGVVPRRNTVIWEVRLY